MKRAFRAAVIGLGIAITTLTMASRARAEPVKILVAAGNKLGLAAERPLKFASEDAARVREVMVSLGSVKPENAFVLAEPTRAQLFAAIDRARREAEKHRSDEVSLVFYFSGHGDRDALHLGEDRVLLADLSAKLGEVPAGLRIAVTDACRATREKGFAPEQPFAITTTSLPQARGQVWLHAASDGEAAQESDELHGAIFTHAWLNGLRGAADANGDARVTLDESFAFAHSQTMIRSAKSSGVLQKPEAVVTLREGTPVVLTQTTMHLATLALPQSGDTHFLIFAAGAQSVLSELWGAPDRRLAIRIPPGRYVVQRRIAGAGASAQIALGEGETRALEERDFTVSPLEALARKGENRDEGVTPRWPDPASASHEVSVGYDAGVNARTGLVQGPRAAYAYAWPNVAVSVGAAADFAGRVVDGNNERLAGGYARASIEGRLPLGAYVLRGGVGGRAGWVVQTIAPDGASSSRFPLSSTQSAFLAGPEVFIGARAPLDPWRLWFVDAGATASVLFVREDGRMRGVAGAVGGASLGRRFP